MRAVVDIGSNSIKFTLQSIDGAASSEATESKVIALGKGLAPGSPLSNEALARLEAALKEFSVSLAPAKGQIIAVGTAALRNCANPEAAKKLVRTYLGTELYIISGQDEARLSFLGATQNTPYLNPLCIDVGGASTEIGLPLLKKPKLISVPLGALKVHESLLLSQCPVQSTTYQEAKLKLETAFKAHIKDLFGGSTQEQIDGVIAIGGSLMMAAKSLNPASSSPFTKTTLNAFYKFNEKISALTLEQRVNVLGFSKDRAEISCAGLLCLEAATTASGVLPATEAIITEGGLRRGVFLSWDEFLNQQPSLNDH